MAQVMLNNPTTGQNVYVDDSNPDYEAYLRGGFKAADTAGVATDQTGDTGAAGGGGGLKSVISAIVEGTGTLFDQGHTAFDVNQALQAAQADPDIAAKYGDALKTSLADFQFALGQISQSSQTTMPLLAAEQAQARKDLADSEAAAGRAQSGFRKQAEGLLGQQQKAVIQSTTANYKQQAQKLGSDYESQFGSGALAQAGAPSVGDYTYAPVGGVTGTNPLAQRGDVLAKQQQLLALNPTTGAVGAPITAPTPTTTTPTTTPTTVTAPNPGGINWSNPNAPTGWGVDASGHFVPPKKTA